MFTTSPDGSVARRFAVLTLLLSLAVSVAMSLRKGRIPGTALGPSRRIVGVTIISFLAMMFTPTKWTHHFGVFAGLAGSLGALAAVAVTAAAMRSRRNRAMFAAAVLFVMALSFASVNGWWYVSNFGVPWSNQLPEWHFGFTTFLLGLSLLTLLLAAWYHFSGRDDSPPTRHRWQRIAQSPLAIATWVVVLFEVLTLTLGVTEQFPAWSNGRSNLEALTGKTCGLANDVLVEQDPNAGLLNPFEVPAGEALGAVTAEGFGPNGIPSDVSADPVMENPGTTNFADDRGRQCKRGGHPGRLHRRRRGERLQGATAVQPRSRPHTRDGQLARRHPATGRAALGVVSAAAARREGPAAGRFRGRTLRPRRGRRAVGQRRTSGQG